MHGAPCTNYGFRITPEGRAWTWATFDRKGRLQSAGRANTRAVAAAFVVRELTRHAGPAQVAGA